MEKWYIKLTPEVRDTLLKWIKKEFGEDYFNLRHYQDTPIWEYFMWPNFYNNNSFKSGYHLGGGNGSKEISHSQLKDWIAHRLSKTPNRKEPSHNIFN